MTHARNGWIGRGAVTIAALVVLGTSVPHAQEAIVIDWRTKTNTASPASLGRVSNTFVRVTEVNDVLYKYQVDMKETARPIDDFGKLKGLGLTAKIETAAPDPCAIEAARGSLNNAIEALKHDALSPKVKDGKVPSIPLQETKDAWNAAATAIAGARDAADVVRKNQKQCEEPAKAFFEAYGPFNEAVEGFKAHLAAPHVIEVPITLRPDYDYTIIVKEMFDNIPTEGGTKTFTVSPASTVLTLSAGPLVTSLEGRTYTARTAPGEAAGDPTRTLLAVDGSGWRPLGAALLNYELPFGNNDTVGFAASTGPVVQFGDTAGTSALGYFFGVSVHLWHRFYITPGWHLGEFADMPLGFTGTNPVVPSDFGEIVPSKRWSTRFAIGFTYRAADFSALGKKAKVTDTTEEKTEKPKPETPAKTEKK